MAELVDAPASGAGARKGVEVRVLFWAPVAFRTAEVCDIGGNPLLICASRYTEAVQNASR
jgi:hypothetical protein